ncbi:phage tail protein [Ensifer sp. NPDC090286]|uniref:phage tail protein n=1 Tax=Ensifer sp. NPDC090286 TaxID=3363991 RepID=UPI00383B20BD
MAEPYVGQIMMGGFGFAPRSFAFCNGQILAINQNQALFSLVGTTYGGNGSTTFALPNLQGRTPVSAGQSADPNWQPPAHAIGKIDGVENVTLNSQQIPSHLHVGNGATALGGERNPEGKLFGTTSAPVYAKTGGVQVLLSPQTVASTGGNLPHANMQPYNVINFFIALAGVYPSRS